MTVSVGIVTYNSADDIDSLLKSLFAATNGVDFTVYVADNASADNTRELIASRYPQVRLLALSENLGFGAAHNRILQEIFSDIHAIVNPDIVFEEDALTALSAYLQEHDDTVLVTPQIRNVDGTPQAVPRVLPKRRYMFAGQLERFGAVFRRWRDEYTRRTEMFEAPTEIESCTGCFMMARTAALKELGGFDERFFMYMEDADLSRRLAMHGRLMLLPQVSVTHRWEKASGKKWAFLKIHLRSMRLYFAKWRREA